MCKEEWVPVEKVPLRIEEVVATVFYVRNGRETTENFCVQSKDVNNMEKIKEAIKKAEDFYEKIPGPARLVVTDPVESWKCIKRK